MKQIVLYRLKQAKPVVMTFDEYAKDWREKFNNYSPACHSEGPGCYACRGTGHQRTRTCHVCAGTGVVDNDVVAEWHQKHVEKQTKELRRWKKKAKRVEKVLKRVKHHDLAALREFLL